MRKQGLCTHRIFGLIVIMVASLTKFIPFMQLFIENLMQLKHAGKESNMNRYIFVYISYGFLMPGRYT